MLIQQETELLFFHKYLDNLDQKEKVALRKK